jgi:hypothetical protein
VSVRLATPRTYELDGGAPGTADRLTPRVARHAVTVCVPADAATPAGSGTG